MKQDSVSTADTIISYADPFNPVVKQVGLFKPSLRDIIGRAAHRRFVLSEKTLAFKTKLQREKNLKLRHSSSKTSKLSKPSKNAKTKPIKAASSHASKQRKRVFGKVR